MQAGTWGEMLGAGGVAAEEAMQEEEDADHHLLRGMGGAGVEVLPGGKAGRAGGIDQSCTSFCI